MATDFSGCTVHCEGGPGGACFEENYNYLAIYLIIINCIANYYIAILAIIYKIIATHVQVIMVGVG